MSLTWHPVARPAFGSLPGNWFRNWDLPARQISTMANRRRAGRETWLSPEWIQPSSPRLDFPCRGLRMKQCGSPSATLFNGWPGAPLRRMDCDCPRMRGLLCPFEEAEFANYFPPSLAVYA